ncbi:MAG: replication initiator [Acidimicrobiales bacterium]
MTTVPADPRVLGLVVVRAADPEAFEAWRARGKATGWCRHPVRLAGSSLQVDQDSGEVRSTFSSYDQPDQVLLKSCGQRRATSCPSCSAVYRVDAFQLVAAGLRGGKGVPEEVASHPAVFFTLTAPSFGSVHSRREHDGRPRICRPQGQGCCSHGHPCRCLIVHQTDDPVLGEPICPECFDCEGAVIWNALASELWRRTTIGIRRHLAGLAAISRSALKDHVRLSFTKVVEYQRRGVVHVHAVARLDGASDDLVPSPAPFGADLLAGAIHRAVRAASVSYPDSPGLSGVARWGDQLDVHVLGSDGHPPGAAAAYLAKYATKSTEPAGLLDHRLRAGDLERLGTLLSPHLARMVRTAWDLGARPELEHLRLRAWAHCLGFRGHWLTKSRAYSTTFGALRAVRHDWHARRQGGASHSSPLVSVTDWSFVGRGWLSLGDAWLAETAAAEAAEARKLAREERRSTITGTGQMPTEKDGDGRA